jgi:7,8-dihydropterin-6-yl-methyl-4-(beta-D-ribofuranosyl)aminobenzene 5'-phosphate synthase
MKTRTVPALLIGAVACVAAVSWLLWAESDGKDAPVGRAEGLPDASMTDIAVSVDKGAGVGIHLDSLSIVITYDNNPDVDGLRAEWGFSCLVDGPEKTILFDTGGEGPVLMANMAVLGLDPCDVDVVVLSHAHGDHTGGLGEFLEVNPDVAVYVPESFDESFKRRSAGRAREVIEVEDAVAICEDVYSTGEMGSSIKEQALIVRTRRGLIVVTGCAHPGIVGMVERAQSLGGDDVLLVLGGFHLVRAGTGEIADVIAGLRDVGVKYAAPCHCSGDETREMFRKEFGPGYIAVGVGRSLAAADLK